MKVLLINSIFFILFKQCQEKQLSIVKKNNFANHVASSRTHSTASLRLSEANKTTDTLPVNISTSGPKQIISSHLKKMSQGEHKQLIKKFQLLHMTFIN